jgi:heme-degrading monooxygenase HmoA
MENSMPITLFWSRFREAITEADLAAYREDADRMYKLAREQPGFVSLKTYTADDGERLSVVRFESDEQQLAWRDQPAHLAVQGTGRIRYYEWYRMAVCEPVREYDWSARDDSSQGTPSGSATERV